jgi:deoxyribodipyrimidine photo-lyase
VSTAVVLFTRDLRVHDHPALAEAAATAGAVVGLFVLDDAILGSAFAAPNRVAFLLDALRDLRGSLARRGSALAVHRGDVVDEAISFARRCRADRLLMSADVSAYARAREERLAGACGEAGIDLRVLPGVTVVDPGELAPAGGDHYRVFTPYWRRWRSARWRDADRAPRRLTASRGLRLGRIPALDALIDGRPAPDLPRGGEGEGRARMRRWLPTGLRSYGEQLADDATSRLSPYLHFGCLSPLELAVRARSLPGADAFVRQLCWRDFFHQLLAANLGLPHEDYRPRGDDWNDDAQALAAWKEGRTGVPIVDAGMRQLLREGWMPNRARLVAASFLVKDLYVDWRLGARHFFDHLVDGDVANNAGNWQWVAGTGTDPRPNRVLNPTAQARRFDPDGAYVRRHVPELRSDGAGYPAPIVDHGAAARRFRRLRSA